MFEKIYTLSSGNISRAQQQGPNENGKRKGRHKIFNPK